MEVCGVPAVASPRLSQPIRYVNFTDYSERLAYVRKKQLYLEVFKEIHMTFNPQMLIPSDVIIINKRAPRALEGSEAGKEAGLDSVGLSQLLKLID